MPEEKRINQSHEIRIQTDKDLTAASSKIIRYTKPDTTTGQWTASLRNGNELYYQTSDPGGVWEINQAGDWEFIGEVVIGGLTWKTENHLIQKFIP